jgi:hypothetical protein
MIQRLFLYRVNMPGNNLTVYMRIEDTRDILPDAAETEFVLRDFTVVVAQIAMHLVIF